MKLYRAVYKSYPENMEYKPKQRRQKFFEKLGDEKSYLFLYQELSKVKEKQIKVYALEKLYISLWKKKI